MPQSGGQTAGGFNFMMAAGVLGLLLVIGLIILVIKKEKEKNAEE